MGKQVAARLKINIRSVSYTHLDVYKRQVQTNDKVIIMAYADVTPEEAKQQKPVVVFVDENNHTTEITNYERHGEISAIR